jgi:hypothetical protein
LAGIGRRLERLEESSRRSAAADVRLAWEAMSDEEIALVLGPHYFRREPTAEEAEAADRFSTRMPDDLIDRAVGYREGMEDEEIERRMCDLVDPVLEIRGRAVLRCLRANEGRQA